MVFMKMCQRTNKLQEILPAETGMVAFEKR